MAKAPSKIMTIAEKKVAQANLKTAMASHNSMVKAIDSDLAVQAKALASARKEADAAIKAASKIVTATSKEFDAKVKAAQKAFAAAEAKALKQKEAAAKGTAKLTEQMAALDAVVAVKETKTKVKAGAPEAAMA